MTDEKRDRLNELSGKMKEHAETSSERSGETAARTGPQRLKPGATGNSTASSTATTSNTAVKPTATASNTAVKPTATASNTAVKPTATASNTAVKPTAAASNTAVKPTATASAVKPAAAVNVKFTDVPGSAYYYDAVVWAVQQGITSGTTETTFAPDTPCHRGHTATFLWRFLGKPKPRSSSNPFKDVTEGPFYEAILWAAGAGVLPGVTATTFEHTTPCTRRQVLTAMMRAEGTPNATEEEAVKWAAHKGLMTGITGGVNVTCTRSDIVTFLYRVRNK